MRALKSVWQYVMERLISLRVCPALFVGPPRSLNFGHVPISLPELDDEFGSSTSLLSSMSTAAATRPDSSSAFIITDPAATVTATATAPSPFATSYFTPLSVSLASMSSNDGSHTSTSHSVGTADVDSSNPLGGGLHQPRHHAAPSTTLHYTISNHNTCAVLLVDLVAFPPLSQFVVSVSSTGAAVESSTLATAQEADGFSDGEEDASRTRPHPNMPAMHSFAEHALVLPPSATVSVQVTCHRITEVGSRSQSVAFVFEMPQMTSSVLDWRTHRFVICRTHTALNVNPSHMKLLSHEARAWWPRVLVLITFSNPYVS